MWIVFKLIFSCMTVLVSWAIYNIKSDSREAKQYIFNSKIFYIKIFIWLIAGYAIATVLQWHLDVDVHLNKDAIIKQALMISVELLVVIILIIAFFLRGSVKSHRTLINSYIIFLISLPISCGQIISEINMYRDKTESFVIKAKITEQNRVRIFNRHSAVNPYYNYYIRINFLNENLDLNLSKDPLLKIEQRVYETLGKDSIIELKIKRGYLNHPWYQSIRLQTDTSAIK